MGAFSADSSRSHGRQWLLGEPRARGGGDACTCPSPMRGDVRADALSGSVLVASTGCAASAARPRLPRRAARICAASASTRVRYASALARLTKSTPHVLKTREPDSGDREEIIAGVGTPAAHASASRAATRADTPVPPHAGTDANAGDKRAEEDVPLEEFIVMWNRSEEGDAAAVPAGTCPAPLLARRRSKSSKGVLDGLPFAYRGDVDPDGISGDVDPDGIALNRRWMNLP